MTIAGLFTITALTSVAPSEDVPELRVAPFVRQGLVLYRSAELMAGGAGGGVGAQLDWRDRFLANAEVDALWLIGNAFSARLALGAHLRGAWAPAAWLTAATIFGDRLELLTENGARPPVPSWAIGLRVSPLRFGGNVGFVSALEPGIGTDFRGGLCLDLTVIQAGASW